MVFAEGRGRPPKATKESGEVSWDDATGCFIGSKGLYWLGTANGGWSSEKKGAKPKAPKEPKTGPKKVKAGGQLLGDAKRAKAAQEPEPLEEEEKEEAKEESGPTAPKGRKPRKDGCEVTYDFEKSCYKTDSGLYWHGSAELGGGGWLTDAPVEGQTYAKVAKPATKPKRGRPPRCDAGLGSPSYDSGLEVWKTDKGYYWHGSLQLGGEGWTKKKPKKK